MLCCFCWKKNGVFKALALSILPSVVFLFSGIMSRSILLTVAALLFAPAHMPCIITHIVFNGLSAIGNEAAMTPRRQIISGVLLAVIAGGYALYLALAMKKESTTL